VNILKYVFLSFLLICLFCGLFIILPQLIDRQIYLNRLADSRLIIKPPNAEIESTAEYLYNHPNSLPSWIRSISNDIYSPYCVYGDFSDYSYLFGDIAWFINGSRIPDWMYVKAGINTFTGGDSDRYEMINYTCLNGPFYRWLYPGFHLFEIRLQTNPFDSGISYQWGVKVNNILATPLPTLIPQTP